MTQSTEAPMPAGVTRHGTTGTRLKGDGVSVHLLIMLPYMHNSCKLFITICICCVIVRAMQADFFLHFAFGGDAK